MLLRTIILVTSSLGVCTEKMHTYSPLYDILLILIYVLHEIQFGIRYHDEDINNDNNCRILRIILWLSGNV